MDTICATMMQMLNHSCEITGQKVNQVKILSSAAGSNPSYSTFDDVFVEYSCDYQIADMFCGSLAKEQGKGIRQRADQKGLVQSMIDSSMA